MLGRTGLSACGRVRACEPPAPWTIGPVPTPQEYIAHTHQSLACGYENPFGDAWAPRRVLYDARSRSWFVSKTDKLMTAVQFHGGSPYVRQAMAYVLAGGRGSRLMELTDKRAKPAVYFGGKSRIIDFALSNALNSGIRRIAVATQYKAHSLIRHLQHGWNFFHPERNESFDILPASQRVSEGRWYLGTADAVYQNIDIISGYAPKFIVILAGDHVYKMDYELLLQQHVNDGADVTVGCIELPRWEATGFGVMQVDDRDRILSFLALQLLF